jgi:Predicted signal transduction protein|nr:HDOD domain-containing protein [uncultured Treponema sp.]
MSKAASIPIDKSKIEQAVQMNIPISINTYTLPKETENYIVEVAKCFLEIVHQTEIEDYIIYCLNELTTNAKKANTKRIYFKERGFDIYDQKSYDEGILNFKQESLSNIDYYLQQQKKEGLYIKVIMHAKQEHIIFEVRNNVQMVATEFKRIFDRMVVARDYDTVDQAFMQAIDDTEGAGLGLIIMLLMLKKIGLNEDAFELITEKDLTINRITIPIKFEANRHLVELTKVIVDYIDEMPQFPEKIMQIQRLINDPDVTMGAIASLISDDVALTTDLLKLVNSVAFGLTKECMSINDAVKMAGLRGIQHLLYSVGTLEVLQVNGEEQEKLWDHTYKSAFFAYNIAKMQGKSTILEEIYVCALLHDMGKIVFSSIYPDLLQKINGMCAEKNIPEQVMQSVMSGMEHQAIGIAVAEKWHLPAAIVNTIKYQYDPESAPKEYYELVATVSFSEFMLQFMNDTISYAQIPEKLLQLHAIENEDQLRSLCETLNAQFHKPE